MGEEIEIYILKKLDDAINESKDSSKFHLAARFYLPKLHKEFTELKELIENKRVKIKLAAAAAPAASTKESTTTRPPVAAAVATSESNAPAPPAVRDSKLPDHDSKTPSTSAAGGGKKESKATPVDEKESGDPSDAGDNKESGAPAVRGSEKESGAPSDAGDKKESGAPLDAGDKKETSASSNAADEKETDAHSDASDKEESEAPSDEEESDTPSDEEESDTPSDAGDEKETSAPTDPESKTPPAATDQSKAATSAKSSRDESEISPATDAVTGDTYHETITPKTNGKKELDAAPKTATFAKTSSPDDSEITGGGATDHKSKTPPTSAKKESNAPLTDKAGTTDAGTKADATKPVNEEDSLREQLYYLNNVLTEWQMITRKPFSYSLDSISSIKDLSKTLKKIKQDLKPDPTKKTDESSHPSIPPTGSIDNASLIRTPEKVVEFRWSTRLVNLEKVRGFEDKILSLERLLVLCRKDTDPFKAFGIHGMAGVGKTTLCQSIFNRPRVMGYFFPRIWVCLSKQKGEDEDNRKEVVKRMLRCLGIDDKIINMVDVKQGIRGLLFALRLQLTGKRYFIVLDDAYNADEWFKMLDSSTDAKNDNERIYQKFSYGLPKECGGTVIVTSRVEQVVKNMVGDEENLRCIEPLTDQDTCWNIFKDTVEEDGTHFPGDLNKLKAEIVKRCDGLPLAAKLLGQIKHKELTAAGNQRAPIQAGNQ